MRKHGIASLAVVAALVAPMDASAAGKKFEGGVDGGGTVSFTLKKTQNGEKVVKFTFLAVPADCSGSPETVSGRVTFGIKVDRNEFETKAVAGNPDNPKSALKLTGKIRKNSAKGTLSVSGSKVLIDPGAEGERAACKTGKLSWNAPKV